MTVKGFVDGLLGAYVSGWAIAQPDDEVCIVEAVDPSGRTVGRGRAARQRADLAGLGYGRSNFAFRVAIENLGSATALRVLANGVELSGSPVKVGAGLFDGAMTAVNGFIDGWVTERVKDFRPPLIRVLDQDGLVVAEAQSHVAASEDKLFAPASFHIRLESRCYGRTERRLSAFANGVRFAEAGCSLRLKGHLDALTAEYCAGWLLSLDATQAHPEIELFRDGVRVGSGRCDRPRPDLRDLYPQSWKVGFEIPIDEPALGPMEASKLSIRLSGSDVELFEGPFLVGRRPGVIEAARTVARLAHAGGVALTSVERSVLQSAMAEFLAKYRHGEQYVRLDHADIRLDDDARRLNVVIPCYRGVDVTRACIASVLAHRDKTDRIVLINDCSPEPEMARLLAQFAKSPNVVLLTNEANRGFIQSVNRGLEYCRHGDVVLLNSDTRVFAGGLDELWRAAHSAPEIGTATALSNNATIFTYPHPDLAVAALADMSWDEVAAIALAENAGRVVDVPTGHGFCMLIRRELLDRLGNLSEAFGRGYGEENEFCLRAFDLGYRHVAASGCFVEHRESVSFKEEKDNLLRVNLPLLEGMYPEYHATVMAFQARDDLRAARWPLDIQRLRRAVAAGRSFVLVVENWLGGGTRKASISIEEEIGYGDSWKLSLTCAENGLLQLDCQELNLRAIFSSQETRQILDLLSATPIDLVIVHQALGLPAELIAGLGAWAGKRRSIYYAHDFYPICPRTTLLDAIGQYCGVGDVDVCRRCVELGGAHEASRLGELEPAEHRALFGAFLGHFSYVVAPSHSTAALLNKVFPKRDITILPHPERDDAYPEEIRAGSADDILLLGAIGPHKGSARLLELAQRARLTHPRLRFHVIGYTDIDRQLRAVGNVSISGAYELSELPELVEAAGGRFALFLHGWPETFSYTLSEAVQLGLVPIVPDIGAPAERVRAARFGVVYPFPIVTAEVLRTIDDIGAGTLAPWAEGAGPRSFRTPPELATWLRSVIAPKDAPVAEKVE